MFDKRFVIAAVLIFASATATSAACTDQNDEGIPTMSDNGNKSNKTTDQKPREWTQEEMREAEPLPVPEIEDDDDAPTPPKDNAPDPC